MLRAAKQSEEVFVRLTTKRQKTFAGVFVTDNEETMTFIDMTTEQQVTIGKNEILNILKPASLDDVTRVVGLPAVTAWHLTNFVGTQFPRGKVAKVTQQTLFLTIGSAQGISDSQKLSVYRNRGEINDPDTNEVVGIERTKICELTVTEVDEGFSKAQIANGLSVGVHVGDEVEPTEQESFKIAVCPIYMPDGRLTNAGAKPHAD